MNATLHLLVTLLLCTAAVPPLARARWVWRSPATGILLWQMVLLTWVLCASGTFVVVGLAPFGLLSTAGVVGAVGWSWVRVARVRRRHRDMLALVAREDADLPGVLVLDHPSTVAYCLPGRRGPVVFSSGALSSLSAREVAAVLAHERTHARERHDLVLLPFAALRRLLPNIRLATMAADAVALLVEMRADEGACREQHAGSLAHALRRFNHGVPPGALGIADGAMDARLSRLSRAAAPLPLCVRWLVLVIGVTLVSTPLSFLVI